MEALRAPDGSFSLSLSLLAGLMLINAFLLTRLKESQLITGHTEGAR
jgi:hypothetical protein